jgi:hydrogenase expression/formation protein HypC
MCYAVPARVLAVADGRATVQTENGTREVGIAPLPDLQPDEYVLISLGLAVERIDRTEAEELQRLWRDLGATAAEGEPQR